MSTSPPLRKPLPEPRAKRVEIREITDAAVRAFTRLSWQVVVVSDQVHPVVPFSIDLQHSRHMGREAAVWAGRRQAAELGVPAVLFKGGRQIFLPKYSRSEDELQRVDDAVVRRGSEVEVVQNGAKRWRTYGSASDAIKAERRLLASKAARERFISSVR